MPTREEVTSVCDDKKKKTNSAILSDIYKAIREISYGSIQIHIQDGKIVQIDKVSKVRLR